MSSPSPLDAAHPLAGAIVAGKYRIEEVLGTGGMGVVVAATHVQLREPVALKFLHPDFARHEERVERFLREARAAARIKSEHVARVMDVGTLAGGEPFLVMELLVGEDLHDVARRRGPLPTAEVVEYVVQACQGIAEAHREGIVHRDLKPGNLFLTRRADGSPLVKVLDFGISKAIDGSEQTLTLTGDVLGSPLYMSPEQIRDCRHVDRRSDIFALGSILFKLLTGRAPFKGVNSAGTLAKIVADPAPLLRPERPDVSPELEAIVLRCLEKSPEQRFQRVEDLASALSGSLRPASPLSLLRSTMRIQAPVFPAVAVPLAPAQPLAAPPAPPPAAIFGPPPAPIALNAETTTVAGSLTRPARPARGSYVAMVLSALLTLALGGGLVLALTRLATRGSAPEAATAGPAAPPEPPAGSAAGDPLRAERAEAPPELSAPTATASPATAFPPTASPPPSTSAMRRTKEPSAPPHRGPSPRPAATAVEVLPRYGQD